MVKKLPKSWIDLVHEVNCNGPTVSGGEEIFQEKSTSEKSLESLSKTQTN
jgi:hypothetical protein